MIQVNHTQQRHAPKKMFGHKKKDMRCDPMGGSQNSKSCIRRKGWKRGEVDYQKHITLTCNDKIYDGFENTYVCSNISQAPTKQKRQEEN